MDDLQFRRLGHTRSSLKRDHALIAPDSHVPAPLPSWGGAMGIVLISPAMGARMAQMIVTLEEGTTTQFNDMESNEHFIYVLEGQLLERLDARTHTGMHPGSYIYLPPLAKTTFEAATTTRLLVFKKRYFSCTERTAPYRMCKPPTFRRGHTSEVEGKPFLGDPDARLQVLLPDDPAFDMAVNIFTYQPGARLPYVETHIMEHGLMMIAGEGIYRLSDNWYPVAEGDSIWMASYCPQWFAAIGKTPASYIYYKDVNREAM